MQPQKRDDQLAVALLYWSFRGERFHITTLARTTGIVIETGENGAYWWKRHLDEESFVFFGDGTKMPIARVFTVFDHEQSDKLETARTLCLQQANGALTEDIWHQQLAGIS